MRRDVAADGQVLRERLGAPDEDVGAAVHESLVFVEPRTPVGPARIVGELDRSLAVWNRMGRIGDVAVVHRCPRLTRRGRLERQPAASPEIEFARRAGAGGPAVKTAPGVAAALEQRRLRELEPALALEPVGEPRRLDLLAEVLPGGAAEVDVSRPSGRRSATSCHGTRGPSPGSSGCSGPGARARHMW